MKRYILLLLLSFVLPSGHSWAQTNDATLQRLTAWVQKAQNFDSEYTREKVYLHIDNNAYFVGETMWLKAYVMRASTLCPDSSLSRVLYVDLIDDVGETIEHKLLRIDEKGQAEGEFELKPPVTSGYYEVRAYTRAMTNWEGYYSRVIPIFRAKDRSEDPSLLTIDTPMDEQDMPFGHSRPILPSSREDRGGLGSSRKVDVQFFPEGGNRVAGLSQRIAFKVFNGKGNALFGPISIEREEGKVITTALPDAEGMGSFVLPAGIPADEPLYATVGADPSVGSQEAATGKAQRSANRTRFPLPAVDPSAQYTLSASPGAESVTVRVVSTRDAKPQLLGLLVSCRAHPCYFDTLTVFAHDALELELPRHLLRGGVNTIDLFDESGHSLCRRLVWNNPADEQKLHLAVRQNESTYEPFAPVALDMLLTNQDGAAVGDATFSLSVRNADADVVAAPAVDLSTELLLSSEVRGFVDHPEQYFTADDDAHREALDRLLMVQGWSADDFETMAGAKAFNVRQPMEDRLILRGQVLRDNNKHSPWAGLDLHLQMYSLEGASLEGDVQTDRNGCFAFKSNVDFCGTWYAQITTKENTTDRHGNENAKRRWSRVTLDRWLYPPLRPFGSEELVLTAPDRPFDMNSLEGMDGSEDFLFAWADTIPRVMHHELSEATVVAQGKYRGLVGNRYTYNGGETAGLRHSSYYIDVVRENERRMDNGLGEGTILDILSDATHRTCVVKDPLAVGGKKANAKKSAATFASEDEVEMNNAFDEGSLSEDAPLSDGDFVERAGQRYWVFDGEFVLNNAPVITLNNRPCIFFLNNALVGYGYSTSQEINADDLASEFKSAIIMTERKDWAAFWPVGAKTNCPEKFNPYYDQKPYYGIFLYNREDPFRFYTKRGVEKRTVQGFSIPRKFYTPQYNGLDTPTPDDCRRTLCWRPNVTTDAEGHASVFFFNSADAQRLRISVRGITPDGRIIEYDR